MDRQRFEQFALQFLDIRSKDVRKTYSEMSLNERQDHSLRIRVRPSLRQCSECLETVPDPRIWVFNSRFMGVGKGRHSREEIWFKHCVNCKKRWEIQGISDIKTK